MGRVIIEVDNLGKRYVIRHERYAGRHRYRRLSEDLWDIIRRPFLRGNCAGAEPEVEEFWALKNVSLQVHEGEVLGVIGRNGAGKSTLLKILSRITEPSEGRAVVRGRVASLLEVGTGFHPELTGRENIYLNGAILGMTRAEIDRKFDEIVEFAGVEKFLDTPVKRFSSGMYVRLAFAVAAHLEPEILVVDEVLAVGDAEFQKRCLGKMGEVSKSGRTVLFVSHNMAAVAALASRTVLLDRGQVVLVAQTERVLDVYHHRSDAVHLARPRWRQHGAHTSFVRCALVDECGKSTAVYEPPSPLRFVIEFESDGHPGLSLELFIIDRHGVRVGMYSSSHFDGQTLPAVQGRHVINVALHPVWLAAGTYFLHVATSIPFVAWDDYVEDACQFEVEVCRPGRGTYNFCAHYGFGHIAIPCREFRCDSVAIGD